MSLSLKEVKEKIQDQMEEVMRQKDRLQKDLQVIEQAVDITAAFEGDTGIPQSDTDSDGPSIGIH